MRAAAVLLFVTGCELAEPAIPAPWVISPDVTEAEAMRSSTTVSEPPPPAAAPIAPDLVGVPGSSKRWFLALTREERHVVRQICRERAKDPCWGVAPVKQDPAEGPSPRDQLFAGLPGEKRDGLDRFCFHTGDRRACNTPLVVAFDAQPIEFTRSSQRFAFTPGEPVASDWPSASTPWIALDRDGDGAITSGAELFGDSTGDAKNGFEALAALDDNHDGVIDRADAVFAKLLLWSDANGDRLSSPAELSPLSGVVVAIPLAHEVTGRCVAGNCEGERGTLTWREGGILRTGAVVDVYLRTR